MFLFSVKKTDITCQLVSSLCAKLIGCRWVAWSSHLTNGKNTSKRIIFDVFGLMIDKNQTDFWFHTLFFLGKTWHLHYPEFNSTANISVRFVCVMQVVHKVELTHSTKETRDIYTETIGYAVQYKYKVWDNWLLSHILTFWVGGSAQPPIQALGNPKNVGIWLPGNETQQSTILHISPLMCRQIKCSLKSL